MIIKTIIASRDDGCLYVSPYLWHDPGYAMRYRAGDFTFIDTDRVLVETLYKFAIDSGMEHYDLKWLYAGEYVTCDLEITSEGKVINHNAIPYNDLFWGI